MTDVLRTQGLSVRFGGVQALCAVGLHVEAGEILGLIGPNGAGKTTLIDAVCGFVPATGTVTLVGHEVSHLSPEKRARRGLGRTWQAAELFEDLSVRDNLIVAASRPPLRDVLLRRTSAPESVDRALGLLEIEHLAHLLPGDLPQGHRRIVGVARALAAQPAVLLLDEPAAGLDTKESKQLAEHLHHIAERGTSVLLIDHDMSLVLSVCDRVSVLDFGVLIADGTADQVRSNERVVQAYLGSEQRELV